MREKAAVITLCSVYVWMDGKKGRPPEELASGTQVAKYVKDGTTDEEGGCI